VIRPGTAAYRQEGDEWAAVPALEGAPHPAEQPVTVAVCSTCRVPPVHCLCAAAADDLRYALAQISLIHYRDRYGQCNGCGTSAALCGYLVLLRQVRAGRGR
jgi:hypothetical protein